MIVCLDLDESQPSFNGVLAESQLGLIRVLVGPDLDWTGLDLAVWETRFRWWSNKVPARSE